MEYDKTNGTDYFHTLKAYVEHNLDASKTSAALFVHYNTVKYKINRIRELFALDLFHSPSILQVLLLFRILEYIREDKTFKWL